MEPYIPFEHDTSETATYPEIMDYYAMMSKHAFADWQVIGSTDSGEPLHAFILDQDKSFDPQKNEKPCFFINNGIHPGEPEGIDATMLWVRDLLTEERLPAWKAITIVIIPVYNVGGCINRNSYTRANQNGPNSYGFRGNAKYYDLNRDFIKTDSENAQSFNRFFTAWQPLMFIDNHTSNGADYSYTMTIIATQKDKLPPPLSHLLTQDMLPYLYQQMTDRGWPSTPYVYAEEDPAKGIMGFLDSPRYSTGYAALHQVIGFMPETHMLKAFPPRVAATLAFMESGLSYFLLKHSALAEAKEASIAWINQQQEWPIQYELDKEKVDQHTFHGYEAEHKASEISGHQRLLYNQEKPYVKEIPHYNTYRPSLFVKIPKAYIIPRQYKNIIEKLANNHVQYTQVMEDSTMDTEFYRIVDYKTVEAPYEGHYLHSQVQVEKFAARHLWRQGYYLVPTEQQARRYIIEVLEPQASDSFFAWNFFDAILQQKEHFSPYVFEDLAASFLAENPTLKTQLEFAKEQDPALAANGYAQLEWIYQRSPWAEPMWRVYPIGRIH